MIKSGDKKQIYKIKNHLRPDFQYSIILVSTSFWLRSTGQFITCNVYRCIHKLLQKVFVGEICWSSVSLLWKNMHEWKLFAKWTSVSKWTTKSLDPNMKKKNKVVYIEVRIICNEGNGLKVHISYKMIKVFRTSGPLGPVLNPETHWVSGSIQFNGMSTVQASKYKRPVAVVHLNTNQTYTKISLLLCWTRSIAQLQPGWNRRWAQHEYQFLSLDIGWELARYQMDIGWELAGTKHGSIEDGDRLI